MTDLGIEFRPTLRHALSILLAGLTQQSIRVVVPVAVIQIVRSCQPHLPHQREVPVTDMGIEFRPTLRHALSMLLAALTRQSIRVVMPVAVMQKVADTAIRFSAASLEA